MAGSPWKEIMTFTNPTHWHIAIFASLLGGMVAIPVGHTQQPKPRAVTLTIKGDKTYEWIVDHAGDGFAASRWQIGDPPKYLKNFSEGADWMRLGGYYMGYDLTGKNSTLVAVAKDTNEAAKWHFDGGRFGLRLQALKGPYKDWWVGLRLAATDGKTAAKTATLELVKEKKDAAIFCWEDPYDAGR
jgi:hypothetical protein